MRVKLEDVCERGTSSLMQKDITDKSGIYPVYGASGWIGSLNSYQQENKTVAVVKDGAGIGRTMLLPEKSSIIGTMQYLVPKDCVEPEYLYYVVKYMHLEKYFSGATIPHIYFRDYKAEEFNLHNKEEQKKIVDVLRKVEKILAGRQHQLSVLDDLIKARFVEMFGDPECGKSEWLQCSLGKACELNPKKSKESRLQPGLQVSFVPMPAVSENGKMDASIIKTYDEVKTGFTYFAENDVLFAKITPCMENGKGAVAINLKNGIGFGSTEFHVLRPLAGKTNPYWIYALVSFEQFRKAAAKNMTGSAGQQRVPASFLENYKISLPPLELQNDFAAFVEEVDKSRADVQKALDQTQLLFDSLMQQYFG